MAGTGRGFGIPQASGSFTAGADLSAYQFHAVILTSAKLALATSATVLILGVLQDKPNADGRAGSVCVFGESKMVAGGAITAGQFVVADASGHAVAVTLGTTTTNVCIGRALEDATTSDVFRLHVNPHFIQV